jgi:hypothetical protein
VDIDRPHGTLPDGAATVLIPAGGPPAEPFEDVGAAVGSRNGTGSHRVADARLTLPSGVVPRAGAGG